MFVHGWSVKTAEVQIRTRQNLKQNRAWVKNTADLHVDIGRITVVGKAR